MKHGSASAASAARQEGPRTLVVLDRPKETMTSRAVSSIETKMASDTCTARPVDDGDLCVLRSPPDHRPLPRPRPVLQSEVTDCRSASAEMSHALAADERATLAYRPCDRIDRREWTVCAVMCLSPLDQTTVLPIGSCLSMTSATLDDLRRLGWEARARLPFICPWDTLASANFDPYPRAATASRSIRYRAAVSTARRAPPCSGNNSVRRSGPSRRWSRGRRNGRTTARLRHSPEGDAAKAFPILEKAWQRSKPGAREYIGEAFLVLDDLLKTEEHLAIRNNCGSSLREYSDLKKACALRDLRSRIGREQGQLSDLRPSRAGLFWSKDDLHGHESHQPPHDGCRTSGAGDRYRHFT